MKQLTTTYILVLTAVFFAACHDDDDIPVTPPAAETEQVSIVEGSDQLSRYATYEHIVVSLAGSGLQTGSIKVMSSDDWLSVVSDTLAADSIVAFTTTDNDTDRRRTAQLTFTSQSNPYQRWTLELTQLSAADNSGNGEDARSSLYVGYGYNVYVALENPMAVRTLNPVLDLDKIRQNEAHNIYSLMQDCRLNYIDMEYSTAYSLSAMGVNLTERQTGDTDNKLQGCATDCKQLYEAMDDDAKGKLTQNIYGQGTLEKAVASRIIDKAMLLNLRDHDEMPYSNEFQNRVLAIRHATGDTRYTMVRQLLREYGTHVVTQVDLGGSLRYIFTMDRHSSFNSKKEMEQEIKYTLGQMSDEEVAKHYQKITSSKTADGALKIHGGDEATRKAIQDAIADREFKGHIDPSSVNKWLSTIQYTDHLNINENLDVIHFELMPMWDIVPKDLRQEFLNEVMRMREESDFLLPDDVLGTDIYEFDTEEWSDLFDFSRATADSTLCRLVYIGYDPKSNEGIGAAIEDATGTPVLEVCSEYVPAIRTDQRVTIVYPIYDGHIYLNQGYFIGDGIHKPALVGFKGSETLVLPVESMPTGSYIKKFWYVGGNLSLDNPTDVTSMKGKGLQAQGDYFYYYYDGTFRHPIVKIGSNFWTRSDVYYYMGFTSNPNSRKNRSDEHMVDGTLYTRFYYDIGYYQNESNGWLWGNDPNQYYDNNPNMKWYMPRTSEVEALHAYLGFNPKALYQGQQSGFNAQFHGYYGVYDMINNTGFGTNNAVRYRDEYMFLASRTDDTGQAKVLVLDRDYHLQLMEPRVTWSDDYFPLRPVRGWMYNYPKWSEIIFNVGI